ncbi:DUF1642 domain-containing protein [Streptococcus dysgalactiae subsp. equisimilis]|uniref:DUF1642 domain-containing protein n=1 Tax=Streptococcus dysgalactiae TaxID=1334 RepID=UPI001F129092|nr:DUF1642 domain-containing protein [Streptococcus dysgalactiae]MCL6222250.1 DUF1642 domain-containing protein [Streptococcus dysgalactiae subsp. equisimilis]UMY67462.1 DUF1642 domain-containing protein [Streptococcus dysgalactiae subsp. equisimilis]
MKIEEVLYLPVKRGGFSIGRDEFDCKHCYITLDGDEVASSFKAKSKEELLDQQKPEVPQFVADWIEEHKQMYGKWDEEDKSDFVFRAINDLFRFGTGLSTYDFDVNDELSEWTTKNAYKFIIAILFGYTIEKEKKYKVRDKRLSPNQNYLNFDKNSECWFFSNGISTLSLNASHTRKALEESGFNVFYDDNYEIIEVTE